MSADGAALVATVLAVAGLVVQIAKLRSSGDVAGLSPAWPALGAVTEAGWSVYAVHEEAAGLLPSALAMVVFNGILLALLIRSRVPVAAAAGAATAGAGALVLVTVLGGWPALGLVLGIAYGGQIAPLLWRAYRTPVPSGIAPLTWVAALAEFGLWWVYGLATTDQGVLALAAIGTVTSIAVLARWAATCRRQGPDPAAATPNPAAATQNPAAARPTLVLRRGAPRAPVRPNRSAPRGDQTRTTGPPTLVLVRTPRTRP